MRFRWKDTLTFTAISVVLGTAIWQHLQIVALAALVGCVGIIYQSPTRRLLEIILTLLQNARSAKVGSVELQSAPTRADLTALSASQDAWRQVILAQLDSSHVGLLLHLQRSGSVVPHSSINQIARDLRERALVQHDGQSLSGARGIELTALGADLALSILNGPVAVPSRLADSPQPAPAS